ncbi:hypothetical protein [[Pseudomonas] boreopolis]|uniref:hypothetical protein n=1 Tax=Xanthomonas boreopolis TaxID=86183 RepID=UPI003D42C082
MGTRKGCFFGDLADEGAEENDARGNEQWCTRPNEHRDKAGHQSDKQDDLDAAMTLVMRSNLCGPLIDHGLVMSGAELHKRANA